LTDVQIDIATAADLPSMLEIINSAFVVETFIEGTRTNEKQLRALMRKGQFLVARDEDRKIGASIYTELRGDRGYFGMLAVDPSRQGTGLGRVMVQAAEDSLRASGCSHVDISVLSLRTELFPFYVKLGYTETGTVPYHAPEQLKPGVVCNQVLMSKPLRAVTATPRRSPP
jgi:predicted N-acetyltransferase YhbS